MYESAELQKTGSKLKSKKVIEMKNKYKNMNMVKNPDFILCENFTENKL